MSVITLYKNDSVDFTKFGTAGTEVQQEAQMNTNFGETCCMNFDALNRKANSSFRFEIQIKSHKCRSFKLQKWDCQLDCFLPGQLSTRVHTRVISTKDLVIKWCSEISRATHSIVTQTSSYGHKVDKEGNGIFNL